MKLTTVSELSHEIKAIIKAALQTLYVDDYQKDFDIRDRHARAVIISAICHLRRYSDSEKELAIKEVSGWTDERCLQVRFNAFNGILKLNEGLKKSAFGRY